MCSDDTYNPGDIPYNRNIWWWIKFGDLAVYLATAKLKNLPIYLFTMAILDPTAKFVYRQYKYYTVPDYGALNYELPRASILVLVQYTMP